MRGLVDEEREYLLALLPGDMDHESEMSTDELALSERLTRRGLVTQIHVICPDEISPDPDYHWVHEFDQIAPLGRLALECDTLARRLA